MRPAARLLSLLASLLLLSLLANPLTGCQRPPPGPSGKRGNEGPVTVRLSQAELQSYRPELTLSGQLQALRQVQLKSRIEGEVRQLLAPDGAMVQSGQAIVSLDDRDAAAQLARAEAQISREQSNLQQLAASQQRRDQLAAAKALSTDEQEKSASQQAMSAASLNVLRAERQLWQLQHNRSVIRAPFAGQLGRIAVSPGSLVRPGDSEAIVTLTQLDPIAVQVSLPATQLEWLRQPKNLTFLVDSQGQQQPAHLDYIDPVVDPVTGNVKILLRSRNPQLRWLPGLQAEVRLSGQARPTLHLPADCVQIGPDGPFVYRLEQGKAKMQPVQLLAMDKQSAWLAGGLHAGDNVIADNFVKLKPGQAVQPK